MPLQKMVISGVLELYCPGTPSISIRSDRSVSCIGDFRRNLSQKACAINPDGELFRVAYRGWVPGNRTTDLGAVQPRTGRTDLVFRRAPEGVQVIQIAAVAG